MKKLIVFCVVMTLTYFLGGCSSDIDSKNIKAANFLCHDQGGVAAIELDPFGTDLYICRDGAQFVVSVNAPDDEKNKIYRITYCENDEKNNVLTEILRKEKKK
jgi:hypothetical protein